MRGSNILGRSLSLFPLWPLVLGVTFGILSADYYGTQHWVAITLISIAGILAFRRSDITLFIVTFILASGLHGPKIENLRAWSHAADTGKLNGAYTLKGVIIATGSQQNGPYLVKTSKIQAVSQASGLPPASGMVVQLTTPHFHESTLQYGDIIETVGPLQLIKPLRNPHGFDRQTWLYRQGANLTMAPRSPVTILGLSLVHRPVRIMANWRQSIRQSMTSGLDADAPSAQLIRAVVLGERPGRSSSMVEDFRKSGTLHVFAVSGLHVGMVGTIFGCLLWFLRAPRWVIIGGVIAAMTAYAGITGLRPPSVRAVIMATVFLTGFLIKRKPSLINSLGASAIIVLLWDGHQLFTPGFQLSYGVLLTLAMATAFWIRILKPMAEIDPFMPRLLLTPWQERILGWRKWLRNSLSVSLAAWMGSAPLIWIHFGIVTPIAVIAGIPLMLMVFVILALAMLAISAGALWQPAGDAVNHINSWVAKSTYHTAAAFAHIPGAYWHKKPTRPEKGQIIVFDIPNGGGANLIDTGGGILLDGGRDDTFFWHVLPTLQALKIEPDSLIISHADSKHSGSMSLCLDQFTPRQAIIPRADLLSKSYQAFIKQSAETNCQLITPHSGQTFPVEPGVALEIMQAPVELRGYGRADDSGLVIRLHWHGWKIMFTGDAGFITETRLLASGADLQADVIISGRNRGDHTGREEFYRAVSPQVIISSNSEFPANERIPENWFTRTEALGITTIDQQQSGAVTLTIKDQRLVLTPTLKNAEVITIDPRSDLR